MPSATQFAAIVSGLFLFAAAPGIQPASTFAGWQHSQDDRLTVASSQKITIGGAVIQLDIAQGPLDLPASAILGWAQNAAQAVSTYYGKFPVQSVRLVVIPFAGKDGIMGGTTWGDRDGFDGYSRLRIGEHVTQSELDRDWTLTHELVHMAFPNLPEDQHWMEEGLATYIEPIARVQSGGLSAARIWNDMASDMPKGEPAEGDQGLDRTHTWGRTYWGGAMFCLMADVAIRRQTGNRKGLQDALRAIVRAGGTINHDWPLPRALAVGDQATGTTVLTDQYKQWSGAPSPVDLESLWKQLGVHRAPHGAEFDSNAPLAKIREAITAKP
jgi:hypothetical protein